MPPDDAAPMEGPKALPSSIADLVRRLRNSPLVTGSTLHAEAASALERLSTELESLRSQSERLVADKEALAREREEEQSPWWSCCGCGRHARDGWKQIKYDTPGEPIEHDMECPDCESREIEESVSSALHRVCAERDALRAELADRTGERDAYMTSYAQANARIAALEAENRQLALDLQAAEARASGAEAKARELNKAVASQEERLVAMEIDNGNRKKF